MINNYPTFQCRLVPIEDINAEKVVYSVRELGEYRILYRTSAGYARDILNCKSFLQFHNGKEWVTDVPKVLWNEH